jgi:hypothetical protein
MRKLAILAIAALVSTPALAVTLQVGTLNVTSGASTSLTCPLPANLPAPVAPGTVICTFTVAPVGWQGTISNPVGGADSAKFVVAALGANSVLEVGATALTATGSAAGNGQYVIGSVTATP